MIEKNKLCVTAFRRDGTKKAQLGKMKIRSMTANDVDDNGEATLIIFRPFIFHALRRRMAKENQRKFD